ncbi:hypothetical protein OIU77_001936 [Salix suchowensis]|uniref:Uncharacterized protein n=1 Tax=Salix suchowensis TaxID=1278906 RepID=A0ABQ9B339_9ROSI|nr:hypothetical protein OIU77_001936 [Salix suchowensis]
MDNFRSMINFQDVEELMELAPEKDGKAYAYLLNILAPDHCNPSMLDTKDPKDRVRVILDHAERASAILKRVCDFGFSLILRFLSGVLFIHRNILP